jgi:hypothetical protein
MMCRPAGALARQAGLRRKYFPGCDANEPERIIRVAGLRRPAGDALRPPEAGRTRGFDSEGDMV